MSLPAWYLECAEDYLSILRNSHSYSQAELFQATKTQRLAEYKLWYERRVKEKECINEACAPPGNSTIELPQLKAYNENSMYQGSLSRRAVQSADTKMNSRNTNFWNILKGT